MIDQAVERAKGRGAGASRRSEQRRTESRMDKRGRREEESEGMESGRRYKQ
jgi:hypothetical protein